MTRFLDYIRTTPGLAHGLSHSVQALNRRVSALKAFKAGVIVSHIVVSWRNMPFFLALRARNPRTRLFHVEHGYSAAFFKAEVRPPGRFRTLLTAA